MGAGASCTLLLNFKTTQQGTYHDSSFRDGKTSRQRWYHSLNHIANNIQVGTEMKGSLVPLKLVRFQWNTGCLSKKTRKILKDVTFKDTRLHECV